MSPFRDFDRARIFLRLIDCSEEDLEIFRLRSTVGVLPTELQLACDPAEPEPDVSVEFELVTETFVSELRVRVKGIFSEGAIGETGGVERLLSNESLSSLSSVRYSWGFGGGSPVRGGLAGGLLGGPWTAFNMERYEEGTYGLDC